MKLKIKKGDTVAVISGNDRGKTGRVLEVDSKKMRILIEGISIRKKHSRPSAANQQGGIVSMEMPIHYSNVQLVDSEGKPTRVSIKPADKASAKPAVRIARTNGKEI